MKNDQNYMQRLPLYYMNCAPMDTEDKSIIPTPAPDRVIPTSAPDRVIPTPAPDRVIPTPAPDRVK